MKAYLLDIEGTTTPIDFVHKVLFPYARERVMAFVQANFDMLQPEIVQLAAEHAADSSYMTGLETDSARSVADYLTHLIETDRKSTPLKSIQGKIWRAGYESGELRSQIYEDVPRTFERWKIEGKTIAIYSSGSILAQKDLFKYTDHGDLTPFISDYFDTNVGGKRESESYAKIAEELGSEPADILFVSDVQAELNAAALAGLRTALSIREGNPKIIESIIHPVIRSFDDISS